MTSIDCSKRGLVLVTGASRGIGRTISVEISRNLKQSSIIVLLARTPKDLEETRDLIQEVNKSISVLTKIVDLSTADTETYTAILNEVSSAVGDGIEFGIIFHNAGTLGELKRTTDLTDFQAWRQHFDLNLFSAAALNSAFIKAIRPIARRIFVVNITSLCGRDPFKNLAMYGASKAARELFFKVLAREEEDVIVLSYSPGPVDTGMFDDIIATAQSAEVQSDFRRVKETTILTPKQTVEKLIALLEKGEFKSGDTIDYYGRI